MSNDPYSFFFFFNDTATTEIYTLSLHDALPISVAEQHRYCSVEMVGNHQIRLAIAIEIAHSHEIRMRAHTAERSEEHTSELQSRLHLVCRLLLEKKKNRRPHHDDLLSASEYE